MNIGKVKDNYNKDGKSRCFNCNIYRHMVKDCRKKEKLESVTNMTKCYKLTSDTFAS